VHVSESHWDKSRDLKAVHRQSRLRFVLQVKAHLCVIFHCQCAQHPCCSTIRSIAVFNHRLSVSFTAFTHRHSDLHRHTDRETCFKWNQLGTHCFLVYLFQLLYMFRATMCPSSEELTASIRHWYFSLCVDGCLVCCSRPDSHPYKVKNTSVT